MSLVDRSRSLSRLLGDALDQLGALFQTEIRLAEAEMSEKVANAGRGVAFLVAATIFLVPVVTLLFIALALWLREASGMSLPLSFVAAAAIGALIGLILAFVGRKQLRPENLRPDVTLDQIRRDIAAAKDIAK